MKHLKKILFTVVLLSVFLLCTAFADAASNDLSDFGIIFTVNEQQFKVECTQKNNDLYLFIPSDAQPTDLILDFSGASDVFLDGKKVASGDPVVLQNGGEYTLSCNETQKKLLVFISEGTASLHIATESGSMDAVHADKSHKEPASIVILSDGEVAVDSALDYIKGRGNATWGFEKKPYNIKFNKKTSLFGMDKAKKWTLLANYYDKTIMRNATAFSLAQAAGIEFTSEFTYVDLYINNEYYGSYLLCESVEVGSGRVDITDLEKATEDVNDAELDEYPLGGAQQANSALLQPGTQKWVNIPNNPDNITGGYLLEFELGTRYPDEVSGFITNRNQAIVLKAPEYASQAQVEYISSLYQEFEDAVFSENGYNAHGKHYTDYIDVESFVKMYVFQEYVKNLDAALTSFYIYKDADSDLFKAAPVWDFDKALGASEPRYGTDIKYPAGWWAGVIHYMAGHTFDGEIPTLLNALFRQNDFFALACKYWHEDFSPLLTEDYFADLADRADTLTATAVMNSVRWNYYGTASQTAVADAYLNEVESNLINFMVERKAFLDNGFSDSTVRVFYDSNGGNGQLFNEKVFKEGDSVTLPACTLTRSGMTFAGWSTSADGSTGTWNAGDSVPVNGKKVTFFAIWEEIKQTPPADNNQPTCDHLCHSESGFLQFIWKILRMLFKIFGTQQVCECGAMHY